jgi:hypothetical protein
MATVEMSIWVPAISALAGAVVGSIAPIVLGVIQTKAEHRRERMRLATQLAIEDHHANIEIAKINRGKAWIPPLSLRVAYHADLLELLATGKHNPGSIR